MSAGLSGVPCAMTRTPTGALRIAHPRVLSACTRSTTAARIPTSASGSTPCPRLKTCPVPSRRRRRRASTCRVAASTTGQGAPRRGPDPNCPARPGRGPTRRRASSSGTRQSTPTTSEPGGGHEAEELTGSHAEEDGGHPEVGDPVEDGPRGREDELLVLVGGERPGPAVEELDGLGPGLHLGPEEGHRHGGQTIRQPPPQGRVAVHERLHLGEGARRAALDEVAGHGERRTGEADEGGTGARQLAGHQAGRLGDVGQVGLGLERA